MTTLAPQSIAIPLGMSDSSVPTVQVAGVHVGKIRSDCRSRNQAILVDEDRMVAYILHAEKCFLLLKSLFSERLLDGSFRGKDWIYDKACFLQPQLIQYNEDYRSFRPEVKIVRTRDHYTYTDKFRIPRAICTEFPNITHELRARYPDLVEFY